MNPVEQRVLAWLGALLLTAALLVFVVVLLAGASTPNYGG